MALEDFISILRPADGLLAALAVLVGFLVASSSLELPIALGFALLSVFLFSGAGIALNDFFDFEMDKVNAPHRPLPSGRISRKTALYYSAGLFAIALFLAALINQWCLGLAALNTVLEILYAWKLKRIALVGNFTDSWFPASSFLYGALVIPTLGAVPILAGLAFLANTGREIFGDLEDVKGDRKTGARTLPIVLGKKKARIAAQAFIFAAVILSLVPWVLGMLSFYYMPIVLLADAVFLFSLFQPPAKNQALTKAAMLVALLAFLAGTLAG